MEDTKSIRPSETQVEIIMSDWLGNSRDENGIHKNTDKGISHCRTTNLTDYYFDAGGDLLDRLKHAREFAQSMVDSMTDDRVKVMVGGDTSVTSMSEGDNPIVKINVATNHFDDKTITVADKFDIMGGYAIHEAAHVKYSEMSRLSEITKKNDSIDKFRHTIVNIIEDERIEHLVGEDYPGFADFIGTYKDYLFGKMKKELPKGTSETPMAKIMKNMFNAIRYPSSLDRNEVIEQYEPLSQIRRILTPFPSNIDEVAEAAEEIIDVLRTYIEDENKKQKKEQDNNTDDSNEKSSSDRQQSQDDDLPQGGNGSSNGDSGGGEKKGGNGNADSNSQASGNDALADALNDAMASAVNDIINRYVDATGDKQGSNGSKGLAGGPVVKEYVNGDAERVKSAQSISFIRKCKGNREVYERSKGTINEHIRAVRNALALRTMEKDYTLEGCKSGRLNTYKLVSFKLGNERVFTRQGEITTDSACICILIDESSSMRGRNEVAARNTAVLINEAVSGIKNIELFVYGFTTGELNIYKEGRISDKWGIGSTKSKGCTPTGDAMELAGKRIRKITDSNCIMLVITDGQPDSNQKDKVVEQDTQLKKKGIYPIGIGINNNASVNDIFKESIVFDDMENLAPALARIVKKKLMKLLVRRDSLVQ